MALKGQKSPKRTSTLQSSSSTLLEMLERSCEAKPDRGIYLTDARGAQEFRTYSQLLEGARRVSVGLERRGIQRHDRIILALPSSFDFIEAFFGAMALGATPVPIAPPEDSSNGTRSDQAQFFVRFSERLNATGVIFRTRVGSAVKPPRYGALKHVTDLPELLDGVPVEAMLEQSTPLPHLAYLQTTSGATATRGTVELAHESVLDNLDAVGTRLKVTDEDIGVSWLPLFNTMGLVGGVLFNIYWALDMALISPERFLRRPEEWLHAIGRHAGTLSVAPSFAYHYTVRRFQRSQLNAIDLSSWRVAMVGGELTRRIHLDTFARRFEDSGFDPSIFLPVYGLAEASLAVAFGPLGEPVRVDVVDRNQLETSDRAEPIQRDTAQLHERLEVSSVGAPLPNVEIKIVDDEGLEVDERTVGEIAVLSPGVFDGYFDTPTARTSKTSTRIKGGWLLSADLGYIADGQLFVLGRKSERMNGPDGRKIFPEDLELIAQMVDGVRYGAVVAFETRTSIVMAYEAQDGADEEELARSIRRRIRRYLDLDVALVSLSPHSIPRSPSGKIRRHICREFYTTGKLDRRNRKNDLDEIRRLANRYRLGVIKLGQNVIERVSDVFSTDS